ncbi:GNAT family N-acetyltransferase, partial [Rhodococcus hoagii]|nr:GNAT family N-acetyltransferase [Prescottella equi]
MTFTGPPRPESDTDSDAVRRILLAASTPQRRPISSTRWRRDPAWVDGLSMLSVDADGEPVGFALLTRCHIGDTPALCLAPCAVLPQYQRTGAGSAAIRAV